MIKDHVLVIGDTHLPWEHPNYLEFCLQIQNRVKCGTVVHIGDLVDNHSMSLKYNADADLHSPKDEIEKAREHLKDWFKAFPRVFLCLGNHDRRVDLKGRHVGLPSEVFKPFREIWDLPKDWKDAFSWNIDGVVYQHGTGLSGDQAHIKAASLNRMSTVIGHTHSTGAINYLVSNKDRIFGMNVGCGIGEGLAFEYGRDFLKKPVLGAGVVTDNGKYCQFFPMEA